MTLLALSLALISVSNAALNQCENTVYKQLDDTQIRPIRAKEVARVDITDNMIFSMDITVNSFPGGWASVFHCGTADAIRQPGIWLHPDSGKDNANFESFTISFGNVENSNPYENPSTELVIGTTYTLELILTQNSYEIKINGNSEFKNDAYPNHNLLNNQPCYVGDPWYAAADVVIENLVIKDVVEQQGRCKNCCTNRLYSSDKDVITPTKGNKLADVAITGYMIYEMDITINSFPSGWGSIFHCGNADLIRQPGIWLHPSTDDFGAVFEGFTISYSTAKNNNPYLNPTNALLTDVKYRLKLLVTPNRYTIFLDGEAVVNNENYDPHNIYDSQPCYAGDPWYDAADVTLEKVKITSINPECEKEYNPSPNQCENVVYEQSDESGIRPSKGNEIARINIRDTMRFSMDITVKSFPSGWGSIFHCGASDSIRQPGIWLHPDSGKDNAQFESFTISFGNVENSNPYKNPSTELVIGITYNLELILTQNSYEILIDGNSEFKDNNYPNHNLLNNQPCYAGDPWYAAADVVIENLVIKEEVEQFKPCQNKCRNRLYTSGNQVIIPTKGNLLGVFPITGYMQYDMEITINSFPSGEWLSVFHCGQSDSVRQPGIWIHPDSDNSGAIFEGFTISYSTTVNGNPYLNPTGSLEIGVKYRLVMIITPNKFSMWVNDKTVYNDENYDAHNIYDEQPCYAGDPWYNTADIKIENVRIFSINADCQRAHNRECTLRGFDASEIIPVNINDYKWYTFSDYKNIIIILLLLVVISKYFYDNCRYKNKVIHYAKVDLSADVTEKEAINIYQ